MAKRPTMTDIAALANVSQATVSLVLNKVPNVRVSAETRQRVFTAAETLGYRKGPRYSARNASTRVIGLLLDEVSTTPFAVPFIEAAHEEAALQNTIVAMFCTKGDPAVEKAALEMLAQTHLVGVLYTTLITRSARLPDHFDGVPTILLNCHERKRNHFSITPGDVSGAFSATEHLLKAGHRRIAHLAGENWLEAARDREKGYRQALTTWDVAVDPALVLRGAWTVDGGRRLTQALLERPDPPTALFCFNDRMAAGAYDAVRLKGLRVPEDLSIVGYDDEETAAYMSPPLTTIKLPHEDMARWGVEKLLEGDLDLSPRSRGRHIKIECPLIERGSVAIRDEALSVSA